MCVASINCLAYGWPMNADMGLLIVAGLVLGLMAAFGYLASRYPVNSRELIEDALVGGHRTSASLWPTQR